MTAGPTREYFDPVRFLSNPSSGRMGYAIAKAAAARGARVLLVSGPTALDRPRGVKRICVTTAEEMYRSVVKAARAADLVFMAAAVSDWRPVRFSKKKIKKPTGENNKIKKRRRKGILQVALAPTQDILEELGRRKRKSQILVGFAVETERLVQRAREKMTRKNLDAIVANGPASFDSQKTSFLIIPRSGKIKRFHMVTKDAAARKIVGSVNFLT